MIKTVAEMAVFGAVVLGVIVAAFYLTLGAPF